MGVGCALLLIVVAGVLFWMVRSARAARGQRWLVLACLIAGIGALARCAWATYPSLSRTISRKLQARFGSPQADAVFVNHVNNTVWPFQLAGWAVVALTATLLVAAIVQIRRARRGADVSTAGQMNHGR